MKTMHPQGSIVPWHRPLTRCHLCTKKNKDNVQYLHKWVTIDYMSFTQCTIRSMIFSPNQVVDTLIDAYTTSS